MLSLVLFIVSSFRSHPRLARPPALFPRFMVPMRKAPVVIAAPVVIVAVDLAAYSPPKSSAGALSHALA